MTRSQLLKELTEQLMAIKRPHPIRVAIDGVDAAGKTSLADELGQSLQEQKRSVIRASIDGFHNPREIRYKRGRDSPEGYYYDSFDYKAIKSLLLEPLGSQGNLQYQTAIFDFRTESAIASATHQAHPKAILLFDGVFLLRPELDNHWDVKIFVDVDFAVSVERATHRDQKLFGSAKAVETRYRQRYVPGQQIYLQSCQPQKQADIIVSNNDPMNPTMSIQRKNFHQN